MARILKQVLPPLFFAALFIQCQLLDNQNPTVNITSPTNGDMVTGDVTVTAVASDNWEILRVEFNLNGELQHEDPSAPFTWTWDTTTGADGEYELAVLAVDIGGNEAYDDDTVVIVQNGGRSGDTTPPLVNLTAPASGDTVRGNVNIIADASDDSGVASVEFFVDGVSANRDSTAPYEYLWNTTAETDGEYAISVTCTDSSANGNTATDSTTVIVDNSSINARWDSVAWDGFDWE